jgi:hypothetical protein
MAGNRPEASKFLGILVSIEADASIPRIKGACTIFPRRLSHELLGAASVMLTIATAAQAAVILVDGVSQLCGNVRGNWR